MEFIDLYLADHKAMRVTPKLHAYCRYEQGGYYIADRKGNRHRISSTFRARASTLCSLLETRGTILIDVKQSEPAQSVNVSSGEAAGMDPLFDSNSRTQTIPHPAMAVNATPSVVEQRAQEFTALALKFTMKTKRSHNDIRTGRSISNGALEKHY